jgi:hypothetical protein
MSQHAHRLHRGDRRHARIGADQVDVGAQPRLEPPTVAEAEEIRASHWSAS